MTENLLDESQEDLPPQIDQNKDYLAELVGENKKFKDIKDLAKGKFEADHYVKILERRLDDMREDYLKMKNETTTNSRLEQMLNQLVSKQTSSEEPEAKEENQPKFDPKQIESLFDSKIQQYESAKRQSENADMVRQKLQQRYGENYKSAVKNQIDELGITAADLEELARTKPKALIRLMGLDQGNTSNQQFQNPVQSQQRRDSFAPTSAPERTWAYYQNLRKTNPEAWADRKTAIQMQEDAIRLGDKFRDGDYFVKGLHE